jgi:RNA polymerase sigma factor (TIGR02999 family)
MPPTGPPSERRSEEGASGAPDNQVTRLLVAWREGDRAALDDLLPLVYAELQRQARFALRREAEGHTLQTTALVHEAYLRLVGADLEWEGSRHFMRVASRAMRRVLVDHARGRLSRKRGGGEPALGLDTLEGIIPAASRSEDLIELDEALERLLALDERTGRAVELHYFGGLSYDEIANALEVSPATVHRDLRFGRAWLYKELQGDGS